MKYPVFAIQDLKVGFYPPEVAQTEDQMIRNFSIMVHSPNTPAGFAPSDFQLYHVGTWDSQTGVISAVSPIVLVVNGAQLLGGDQREKS